MEEKMKRRAQERGFVCCYLGLECGRHDGRVLGCFLRELIVHICHVHLSFRHRGLERWFDLQVHQLDPINGLEERVLLDLLRAVVAAAQPGLRTAFQ